MGKAQRAHHLSAIGQKSWARFALPTLQDRPLRPLRIVASTMSAASTLGDLLPVDMMVSSCANASTCCLRIGVSVSTSRSAGASFSGVQSSCRNSGMTSFADHEIGEDHRRDLDRAAQDEGLDRADAIGRHHRHARQRELQRHRAGFRQRRARDAECGALLLLRRSRCAAATGQLATPSRTVASRCGMVGSISSNARPSACNRPSVAPNTAM